eukprot:12470384-Alexandrium_andersonii.AAC.1
MGGGWLGAGLGLLDTGPGPAAGVQRGLTDVVRHAVLDLEAQTQGYRLWKSKARGYLTGKFPQIGRVLDWAEKQLEPIS